MDFEENKLGFFFFWVLPCTCPPLPTYPLTYYPYLPTSPLPNSLLLVASTIVSTQLSSNLLPTSLLISSKPSPLKPLHLHLQSRFLISSSFFLARNDKNEPSLSLSSCYLLVLYTTSLAICCFLSCYKRCWQGHHHLLVIPCCAKNINKFWFTIILCSFKFNSS